MSMIFDRKLPIPKEVKEEYPISEATAKQKALWDKEIADVFDGKSQKKIVVVGPCSADREDAVCAYAEKLTRVKERVQDELVLIMRVYTNKPRTNGDGYKGMLHQPDPKGKEDVFHGILATRHLHSRIIGDYSLPTADELLYPANHRYLSDLLSYNAVGARSVENQEHRLTASGIPEPVGMKNPLRGDLSALVHAIKTAQTPHDFIYRGWAVESTGNPLSHAILRGYVNNCGQNISNYDEETILKLAEMMEKSEIQNPSILIDVSHGNSDKIHTRQPTVCREVLNELKGNAKVAAFVKGFMIESYLVAGQQSVGGSVFGQSITDACLGFDETENLILEIAEKVSAL